MSGLPAKRSGNGAGRGGPARGYSWEQFQPGHTKSLRHGLYATELQLRSEEEVQVIADAVRASMLHYGPTFELGVQLLAGRIWRLKRAYAFVASSPEGARAKSFEESLNALENVVSRSVARLGLDPIAASELGINVRKMAAGEAGPQVDWGALTEEERPVFERLLGKVLLRGDDGERG